MNVDIDIEELFALETELKTQRESATSPIRLDVMLNILEHPQAEFLVVHQAAYDVLHYYLELNKEGEVVCFCNTAPAGKIVQPEALELRDCGEDDRLAKQLEICLAGAELAKQCLDELSMEMVADSRECEVQCVDVKSLASTRRKATRICGGDVREVADMARATVMICGLPDVLEAYSNTMKLLQRKQEIIYHLRRLIRDKEIADIKKRAELMHAARGGFWSLELALNKARGDWGLVVDLNEALAVELTVSLEDGTRGEPQAHTHSHKILGMGLLLTAAVKLGKVDILDHILGAIKRQMPKLQFLVGKVKNEHRYEEPVFNDPLQRALDKGSKGLDLINSPLVVDYVHVEFTCTLPSWTSRNPFQPFTNEGFDENSLEETLLSAKVPPDGRESAALTEKCDVTFLLAFLQGWDLLSDSNLRWNISVTGNRTLTIEEAKLGPEDKQLAYTLHQLGVCVSEGGRSGEAEVSWRRSSNLGPEGRQAACSTCARAPEIREKALDPDHSATHQEPPKVPAGPPDIRDGYTCILVYAFMWHIYTWFHQNVRLPALRYSMAVLYGSGDMYDRGAAAHPVRSKCCTWSDAKLGVVAAAGFMPVVTATDTIGERLESAMSASVDWLCRAPWSVQALVVTLAAVSAYKSIRFSIREYRAGNNELSAAWHELVQAKQAVIARRRSRSRTSR